MDVDDRVRDTLPVNEPYDALVAQAYDCWLPPDGEYDDRDLYRDAIERGDGPALELGCGNGRLLLDYRRAGLEVDGLDSSADMLAICRTHAETAGVDVTLHHADWTDFDLSRQYATIYNPAGSFSLIADDDEARRALSTWLRHLAPGGKLLVVMSIPRADFGAQWEWKVRRSATRADDGVTFMVHEAMRCDVRAQAVHALHRHELWDAHGELITMFMRRHRLRWWTRNQLEELLLESGAASAHTAGSDDEFMAIGRVSAAD
jgi:SAM-dependent methyltransferase